MCRTGVSDRAVWHFAATMLCSLPSATQLQWRSACWKAYFQFGSNEPSNDTSIPVHSKSEASALTFPNTNCSRLELVSRVEMQ